MEVWWDWSDYRWRFLLHTSYFISILNCGEIVRDSYPVCVCVCVCVFHIRVIKIYYTDYISKNAGSQCIFSRDKCLFSLFFKIIYCWNWQSLLLASSERDAMRLLNSLWWYRVLRKQNTFPGRRLDYPGPFKIIKGVAHSSPNCELRKPIQLLSQRTSE